MKITKTTDPNEKPPLIMLVYGEPGVGKTTLGAKAENSILIDCEGGSKYLGLRDIETDVGHVQNWQDAKKGIFNVARGGDYDTIVLDPIGELMEKIKADIIESGSSKLVQKDGTPTMAGWGQMKERLAKMAKFLRDSGKNVLLVAHLEEEKDGERVIKRPKIQTKISEKIIGIVDVAGYMTVTRDKEGNSKRVIIVDPDDDKYVAKDRSGQLGKIVEPDFDKIREVCAGDGDYSWAKNNKKDNKSEKEETDTRKEQTSKDDVKEEESETKEDEKSHEEKLESIKDSIDSQFTKKKLKPILKKRGLKVSGSKEDLVTRLAKDELRDEDEIEEENEAESRLQKKIKQTDEKRKDSN